MFSKKVAVIYPGFVINTTWSFLRGLDKFRQDIGQEEIDLFIHTWDTPVNIDWLNRIKWLNEKENLKVNIKVETENLDSEGINSFLNLINYHTTGKYSSSHNHKVVKTFYFWYSLLRTYQAIKEDCIVLRVRNSLNLLEENVNEYIDKIIEFKRLVNIKLKKFYPDIVEGDELVVSSQVGSKFIDESVFLHPLSLYQTFLGSDIESLAYKLSIYLQQSFPAGVRYNNKTLGELILGYEIPTEGANIFYFLLNSSDVPYCFDTQSLLSRFVQERFICNSPELEIIDSKAFQLINNDSFLPKPEWYYLGNKGYTKDMDIFENINTVMSL